jgi:cell division protein FtsL
MMLKIANFTLVIVTLITASTLYNLEHTTRAHERKIAKANAEMVDHAEAIKLLKAEWSSLTRPERIKQLAEQQLGMKRIEPDQIVTADELPARLQALADVAKSAGPKPTGKPGSIDDILKKMQ